MRVTASALEVIAIVAAIGGITAGAAITATRHVGPNGVTHPYVAAGNAVILAAILLGAIGWCLGRAIGVFATDVATRHHVNITEPAPSRLPEFLQR